MFWSNAFSIGFPAVFDYVIQLGAIMAVVVVFFNKIFPLKINKNEVDGQIEKRKISIKTDAISMWLKVLVACVPAVFAIFVDELFEGLGTTEETIIISLMLIIYGVLFIIIENINKTKTPVVNTVDNLSYKTAFLIGCFQVLASVPGTSRSGVTIIGALILGVSRVTAAEFTFFLAIPTMVGASGFKILKFFLDGGSFTSTEIWALLLGMIIAFTVSMFAIKALMNFVRKHDFKPFGWYRIGLGILLIIICLILP